MASAIVLGYFVVLFSLISISSFLQKSITVDEPIHLLAGYSNLKWGDFRANPEHPPLAKIWAALPLLAFNIKDPRPSRPHWDLILEDEGLIGGPTVDVARDMFFVDNDAETLFFYAKLQMLALGILLGTFVYLWSKELFGLEAAIVSLFMYGLDPNILAHSQIVHTDIPFSAFFFISTYFFWRTLGQLSWSNLLLTALFFGLAAITKYSYPTIFIAWAILGLVRIFSSAPQQCSIGTPRTVSSREGKAAVLTCILIFSAVIAYLLIWAAFGFRFDAVPEGKGHLHLGQLIPDRLFLRALVSFITEHHLFPEAWIAGQLYSLKYLTRPAYLLGQISWTGFWSYFPIAFAVKTPLPTLTFLMATIGMAVFKWRDRKPGLFLLVPVVVYLSLAVWSRMNIGLRHILPIYPFLFVLTGGTAAELWRSRRWIKNGLILLGVWYLWSSTNIYPHYLAFFNELAGGARNGHEVLIDSNLDWGQDLKGLKHWMDSNGVKKLQFLYFGQVDPEYYGIDAVYLPGSWITYNPPATQTPEVPNYVAISATLLYGSEILVRQEQKEFIKTFASRKPIAVIGYSIYVFKLDESGSQ